MLSRRHFIDYDIPQLYSQIKENVVAGNLKNNSFCSATTDFWPSSTSQPYITLAVHFINSKWTFSLDASVVYEDHTGENIAATIADTLENWNFSFS